jgi:hypothetical protein
MVHVGGEDVIILKRTSGYADKLRAYKVLLDGSEIGSIGDGEIKDFQVLPGKHILQLAIDWCNSNPIQFEITDKAITFECGSKKAFKAAFSTFFKTQEYMWLRML